MMCCDRVECMRRALGHLERVCMSVVRIEEVQQGGFPPTQGGEELQSHGAHQTHTL